MKKYYRIYQLITTDGGKVHEMYDFKEKMISEHSAVEWISDHLKNKKYENNKYTIKAVYEKAK
jgi:hypothetical protein